MRTGALEVYDSSLANCDGVKGAAIMVGGAKSTALLYNTSIIEAKGIVHTGNRLDDGIYINPSSTFEAVGLTVTPACSSTNPFFQSPHEMTMSSVRKLRMLDAVCSRPELEAQPILGPMLSSTTCATSPNACGQYAVCTDVPARAGDDRV